MKTEAHSDVGTVLQPEEYCAIWSPTEGYSFLVPPQLTVDTRIPEHAVALMAAVIRLEDDEAFRNELIEWFTPS